PSAGTEPELATGEALEPEPEPVQVELEEVELTLRTLWFFPEIERAVLVFQGATEVGSPEGLDVRHLLLAAEDRDDPRPLEHYAQALQDRLDPDQGHLASLRDRELLPASTAGFVDEEQAQEQALHHTDRRLEHNLHRRALEEHARVVAQVEAAGLDPAQVAPPAPEPPAPAPSLDELPGMIETLQAEADLRQEQERAKAAEQRAGLRQMLLEQGMEEGQADELLSASEKGPTGPPRFTAEGQRAGLVALLEQARAQGVPTDGLQEALDDPEQHARWEQAEQQLRQEYRRSAHLQDPAPALPAARSEQARLAVREALEAGLPFESFDFTGADLSGMSLRGAKLAGALLESARLDGADLRGADLRGAVLAHASLRGARLDEADLREANLGRAQLEQACLAQADLERAVLTGTILRGAVLRGARLREVEAYQVVLSDADASEVITERLVLLEAEVTGLNLSGAELPQAVLLELDLRGAVLLGARLTQATFVGCNAAGVSLAGAVLDGARFVEACDLREASLAGASARGTNLRGTMLREAVLDHANLEGADLSEADLSAARLYRASARGARFDGASLEDAMLVGANLMQASFLGATIRGADLRGTNLYGADMARVRTDDRVRLDQAELARVRVLPRHQPPATKEPAS
ncbi:MAG: pentapeptide repeat-containing protein, partial [Myxococcales bacterium]|nr:pentapeptide repeat-containing protein [Myxococcales bacterium]